MKLAVKFSFVFCALLGFLGVSTLVLVRHTSYDLLIKDAVQRGVKEAAEPAQDTAAALLIRNEPALLSHLNVVAHRAGAVYAMALSRTGMILAHTDLSSKGKILHDGLARRESVQSAVLTQLLRVQGQPILELSLPVWGGHQPSPDEFFLEGSKVEHRVKIGTVRIGLPLRDAYARESLLLSKIVLIVLVLTLGAGALAIFLVRRLLLPIKILSIGAAEIRRGRYGILIPALSHDELGMLTGDFNRMSQALSETTVSKDYHSALLNSLAEPLIVMAPDATITKVNPALLDLLGAKEPEVVGQPLDRLLAPLPAPFRRTPAGRRVFQEPVRDLELELLANSGERIPVLFSSAPVTLKPAAVVALAKDMRERRKLEERMLRSGKLSAVGQLAAGVAHEINNPLGVIYGFAQAGQRRLEEDHPVMFVLRSIEAESIRCKELVAQLLTFSRSGAQRQAMNINEAVAGAVLLIGAKAKISRIQVDQELGDGLPKIQANRNQIEQIIINLAANAIDAMGENSQGTVTIATEAAERDGQPYVRLRVTDTGSGIPPEILPRIFEPFFTTKPQGQGTGLGLGLVHELVTKHQGRIDVESRPGRTQFTVWLPAEPSAPQQVNTYLPEDGDHGTTAPPRA